MDAYSSMSFIQIHRKALFVLMAGVFVLNSSFSQDWSEKDLIKSVHRAEKTFESGEMSRAYGLFAHLVSVSGDRPFLHYRFGAICTHTGTRLEEAEEHLIWAKDLGILDTEHAAGWHYYTGKLRHLQYRFDEARTSLGNALDMASGKEDWVMDAKLRFGQCDDVNLSPGQFQSFEVNSSLESHSTDYFRLYQLPQESGRLLITPESLLSKEDMKRGYTSIMHWLPGQRFAFFSSYGKKGDTGLDVYRVSVSSSGSYGIPEKLPEPVNSDFDDLHPICIPAKNAYVDPDLMYFSSSRPESLGGVDIFQVYGLFTGESLGMVARETLEQLPFEINSTHDEWLFWFDESKNKGWLSTNRLKDFEGKEIWQFEWGKHDVVPVSIRIETTSLVSSGILKVLDRNKKEIVIEHRINPGDQWDLVVEAGDELQLIWQDFNGITHPLELRIPLFEEGHVALESAKITALEDGSIAWQSSPKGFVPEYDLAWSNAAREARHHHGTWIFETTKDQTLELRGAAESNANPFLESRVNSGIGTGVSSNTVPEWFIDGFKDLQDISFELDVKDLVSSQTARSMALVLQNRMEALSCWTAPGSKDWKAHEAIERIGEPVLASIAQEAYELKGHVKNQALLWDACIAHIEKNFRLNPANEAEYIALKMYLNNHFLAYKGAENQSDDLIRRIEVHLQFERWLSEAFPLNADDQFQRSLVHLILYEKSVSDLVLSVGDALSSDSRPESDVANLQSMVWQTIADSIVEVQRLGVFALPEMEPAQKWFLRSGNLMAEIDAGTSHLDAIGKGRRSISLAWDAFQEGKQKRDVVYADLLVSSGEWWNDFGSRETEGRGEAFEGYELFVKGDAMILEQAELYQAELDLLRLDSPHSISGREAVKKAIAIRSNMISEMESMFNGSERNTSTNRLEISSANDESEGDRKTEGLIVERASTIDDKEVVTKTRETVKVNNITPVETHLSAEKMPEETGYFSVQVGAFRNSPDWSFDRADLRSKVLGNGLTAYAYGCYETKEEASEAMESFMGEIPDAFIVQCSTDPNQVSPSSEKDHGKKSVLKSDQPIGQSFRVRVASFGAQLRPAEVARMLRFGNVLELKSVRLSNSTTYYSEVKGSEQDAQITLDLCLQNGFSKAIIEILD
jgi:hypothetical protein